MLFDDRNICTNLQVQRPLLMTILAEIRDLFEIHAKKYGRFEDTKQADNEKAATDHVVDLVGLLNLLPQGADFSPKRNHAGTRTPKSFFNGVRQSARNLRKISTDPKRLIWAVIDKTSMESFLARLRELNSFLIALLDGSQFKRLQGSVTCSYLEILQLRNDIESLRSLIEALPAKQSNDNRESMDNSSVPAPGVLNEEAKTEDATRDYLIELTKLKINHTTSLQLTSSPQLDINAIGSGGQKRLTLKDLALDGASNKIDWRRTLRRRTTTTYAGMDVWIEWKQIPATICGDTQTRVQQTEIRLRLLIDLLHSKKPLPFCAPTCVGYLITERIRDLGHTPAFGIVFQKPRRHSSAEVQMRTLKELFKEWDKPSLSARMTLCAVLVECIQNFHAVNWMHKGFRSDNILLFPEISSDSSGQVICLSTPEEQRRTLHSPLVSGFELSRPRTVNSMSERPDFDPEHDIYRHPQAQSFQKSQNGSYLKSYDMYSLAIVLLEIAFWKPVELLIGYNDCSELSQSLLKGVRNLILESGAKPDTEMKPRTPSAHAGVGIQASGAPLRSSPQTEVASLGRSSHSSLLERVSGECGDSFRDAVSICLQAGEDYDCDGDSEAQTSASVQWQRVMRFQVLQRIEELSVALQS